MLGSWLNGDVSSELDKLIGQNLVQVRFQDGKILVALFQAPPAIGSTPFSGMARPESEPPADRSPQLGWFALLLIGLMAMACGAIGAIAVSAYAMRRADASGMYDPQDQEEAAADPPAPDPAVLEQLRILPELQASFRSMDKIIHRLTKDNATFWRDLNELRKRVEGSYRSDPSAMPVPALAPAAVPATSAAGEPVRSESQAVARSVPPQPVVPAPPVSPRSIPNEAAKIKEWWKSVRERYLGQKVGDGGLLPPPAQYYEAYPASPQSNASRTITVYSEFAAMAVPDTAQLVLLHFLEDEMGGWVVPHPLVSANLLIAQQYRGVLGPVYSAESSEEASELIDVIEAHRVGEEWQVEEKEGRVSLRLR